MLSARYLMVRSWSNSVDTFVSEQCCCKHSCWPWINQQPAVIILQPDRGVEKPCLNVCREWGLLESYHWLSSFLLTYPCGSEKEMAARTLHVRRRQRLWLAEQRQQLKKGMESPETRAAKLMHVTSMRARRKKFGNGVSSSHRLPVSELRALTPVVSSSFHPVCPCFTVTLQHPQLFFPNLMTLHKVHSLLSMAWPHFKALFTKQSNLLIIGRVKLAFIFKTQSM